MALLAVVCGLIGGYASLGLRLAIDRGSLLIWGVPEEAMPLAAAALPAWLVIIPLVAGGLVIGLLCHFVLPRPMPQGIADVIESCTLHGGRMKLRHGLAAAFVSVGSIASGASVGREGPAVHLGASLAATIAQRMRLGISQSRTLLGCGVAAAVAAAFNAPIGGAFFALELVIGHYGTAAFSAVVLASLVGTVVTRIHIGDDPAFTLPLLEIGSFWELPAFLILGVVAGLASVALIRGVGFVQALHVRVGWPAWLRPAAGGVAVGVIACFIPEVLGVGYQMTNAAFETTEALSILVLLAVAKAAATAISLGSGFGGGIFSPALALGALIGAAFALVAGWAFPELVSDGRVYAVAGMGALAASTLGAPISTVIMVFELTSNYAATFAVMAAVIMASTVTGPVLGEQSFFTWQLARKGVRVRGGLETALLRRRTVRELLRTDQIEVRKDTSLEELKRRYRRQPAPIFVIGEDRRLEGVVTFADLADAAFAAEPSESITASDLARPVNDVLLPGDDLATAIARFRTASLDHVPVVTSHETRAVVGEVRVVDLIEAQNRALLEARAAEQGRRV